jgi:hypothetical protein
MSTEDFLVCGTVNAEDSYADLCSKCGAKVYATIGSHAHARREGIALICVNCFEKVPDAEVAGVMHHGKKLHGAEAAFFLLEFQKQLDDEKGKR